MLSQLLGRTLRNLVAVLRYIGVPRYIREPILNLQNLSYWKKCILLAALLILIVLLLVVGSISLFNDGGRVNDQQPSVSKIMSDPTCSSSVSIGTATSGARFEMIRMRTYEGERVVEPWQPKEGWGGGDISCASSSSKFVVLSTINPSDDPKWPAIRDFNVLPDWCTIVVGDVPSKPREEYMNNLDPNKVVYLDLDLQREVFGDSPIFEHTPLRSFARKNIGYLYAMLLGAEVIYDTDDDNVLIDKKAIPIWTEAQDQWDRSIAVKELADDRLQNLGTFNVFSLFAHRESADHTARVWPRGFDLTVLAESLHTHSSFELRDGADDRVQYPIQQWLGVLKQRHFDFIVLSLSRHGAPQNTFHVLSNLNTQPTWSRTLTLWAV